MSQIRLNTPAVAPNPTKQAVLDRWAMGLAYFAARRRQELGMSIARTAELSGLEACSWCLLEAGWVPDELATMQSIAATLEVRWTKLQMLALLARMAQDPS